MYGGVQGAASRSQTRSRSPGRATATIGHERASEQQSSIHLQEHAPSSARLLHGVVGPAEAQMGDASRSWIDEQYHAATRDMRTRANEEEEWQQNEERRVNEQHVHGQWLHEQHHMQRETTSLAPPPPPPEEERVQNRRGQAQRRDEQHRPEQQAAARSSKSASTLQEGGRRGGGGGRYRGLLKGRIRMRVAPCLGCQVVRHLRETKASEAKVERNKHAL